jgi:hypothetical protein
LTLKEILIELRDRGPQCNQAAEELMTTAKKMAAKACSTSQYFQNIQQDVIQKVILVIINKLDQGNFTPLYENLSESQGYQYIKTMITNMFKDSIRGNKNITEYINQTTNTEMEHTVEDTLIATIESQGLSLEGIIDKYLDRIRVYLLENTAENYRDNLIKNWETMHALCIEEVTMNEFLLKNGEITSDSPEINRKKARDRMLQNQKRLRDKMFNAVTSLKKNKELHEEEAVLVNRIIKNLFFRRQIKTPKASIHERNATC